MNNDELRQYATTLNSFYSKLVDQEKYRRDKEEEIREKIRQEMQDILQKSKHLKFIISLAEVEKPYAKATILAEYIAVQVERRVAFRKAIKKAIQLAKEQGNVKGIKIKIAGRLNGAEIVINHSSTDNGLSEPLWGI